MTDVVDLDQRRDQTRGYKTCAECGSAYFELHPWKGEDLEKTHGVVCVGPNLNISGWSGRLICSNCGAELDHEYSNYVVPPTAPRAVE